MKTRGIVLFVVSAVLLHRHLLPALSRLQPEGGSDDNLYSVLFFPCDIELLVLGGGVAWGLHLH